MPLCRSASAQHLWGSLRTRTHIAPEATFMRRNVLLQCQQLSQPQYQQYPKYTQHFTAALFFIVCQGYHVRRDAWSKCHCSHHNGRCHNNLSWMAHLEESSLRRRNASSAGPRLMRVACGTWRPIRLLTEASPSDRLGRERDEATGDKPASLVWLQKR